MTAYVVSDVGPVAPGDEAAWEAYLKLAPEAIRKYGGRYLTRGGSITVMEGDWSPSALVIVEFPDQAAAARWYGSPEYAEALKIRAGSGLHRRLLCVEGTTGAGADHLLGAKERADNS